MRVRGFGSFLVCLVISGLVISACGGDGGDSATTSTLPDGTSSDATIEVTTSTTPPPTDAFDQNGYGATTVVTGLRIPWEMAFLPDGRLLIAEREGRLALADVDTGEVIEVGRIAVSARGEGGLMGFALDPAFPSTPGIYVCYTTDESGWTRNRVSRFEFNTIYEPPALGVETVILDGIPAGNVHNGSRVAFGPQGYLWITTGDAGDAGLSQQMDSLAGKVLRMTKDGSAAPGNPFAGQPYPYSLIYTLGHRNPQGLDFHPRSGQAFVTEHGPSDNDEVNALEAGGNYGWPDLRGQVGLEGYVDPIATWTPTIAPAGAVFLSGGVPAGLEGTFVFVTLKESDIRVLESADSDFASVESYKILFDGEFGRLRAIVLGPDGALYVATSNQDGRGSPKAGDDRIIRIQAAN